MDNSYFISNHFMIPVENHPPGFVAVVPDANHSGVPVSAPTTSCQGHNLPSCVGTQDGRTQMIQPLPLQSNAWNQGYPAYGFPGPMNVTYPNPTVEMAPQTLPQTPAPVSFIQLQGGMNMNNNNGAYIVGVGGGFPYPSSSVPVSSFPSAPAAPAVLYPQPPGSYNYPVAVGGTQGLSQQYSQESVSISSCNVWPDEKNWRVHQHQQQLNNFSPQTQTQGGWGSKEQSGQKFDQSLNQITTYPVAVTPTIQTGFSYRESGNHCHHPSEQGTQEKLNSEFSSSFWDNGNTFGNIQLNLNENPGLFREIRNDERDTTSSDESQNQIQTPEIIELDPLMESRNIDPVRMSSPVMLFQANPLIGGQFVGKDLHDVGKSHCSTDLSGPSSHVPYEVTIPDDLIDEEVETDDFNISDIVNDSSEDSLNLVDLFACDEGEGATASQTESQQDFKEVKALLQSCDISLSVSTGEVSLPNERTPLDDEGTNNISDPFQFPDDSESEPESRGDDDIKVLPIRDAYLLRKRTKRVNYEDWIYNLSSSCSDSEDKVRVTKKEESQESKRQTRRKRRKQNEESEDNGSQESPLPLPKKRKRKRNTNNRAETARKSSENNGSVEDLIQQRPRLRARRSTNPFRNEVGHHLRTILAVMEESESGTHASGEQNPWKLLPLTQLRFYFKTCDYRKHLLICVEDKCKILAEASAADVNTEPVNVDVEDKTIDWDWEGWKTSITDCSNDSRLYYPSKSLLQSASDETADQEKENTNVDDNNNSQFSFSKELELDGKPNYAPEILSLVGSARLNAKIDLVKIGRAASNLEYEEGPGKPLAIRIRKPNCLGLYYSTGRLVVAGVKSMEEMQAATQRFARIAEKNGHDVNPTDILLNVGVGFVKVPFKIRIDAMAEHEKLTPHVNYNKIMFPRGVIFKVKETGAVCVTMNSGAVFFYDLIDVNAMKTTLDLIYPCLRFFGHSCFD